MWITNGGVRLQVNIITPVDKAVLKFCHNNIPKPLENANFYKMGVGITSLSLRTWIGSYFLYGPSNITNMHEIRHGWTRNIQVTMALCMLGFTLDITNVHPTQVTLLDITASNCFATPFLFWSTASGSCWWNNVRVEETGVRKKTPRAVSLWKRCSYKNRDVLRSTGVNALIWEIFVASL